MKMNKYRAEIDNFIESHEVPVGVRALSSLTSPRFLNRESLSSMSNEVVTENLRIVLDDAIMNLQERQKTAKRPLKLSNDDVLRAVKKHFCNLPPFCKRKWLQE